ncbi:MAG: hypothetical protein WDZ76_06255 [Pseudohongiellaceae bacterium]
MPRTVTTRLPENEEKVRDSGGVQNSEEKGGGYSFELSDFIYEPLIVNRNPGYKVT